MSATTTKAMAFAIRAHRGQIYGDQPFWSHPKAAAEVARRFGLEETLQVAAWLHDVVEDTDIPLGQIEAEFGSEVAALVDAVTEPSGLTRRERHPAAWAKLRAAGPDAVAVKLSDRIANVESCLATPKGRKGLFRMYAKEYLAFREALGGLGPEEMWDWLDQLMEMGK